MVLGKQIKLSTGQVSMTAEKDGRHEYCFSNQMSAISDKVVRYERIHDVRALLFHSWLPVVLTCMASSMLPVTVCKPIVAYDLVLNILVFQTWLLQSNEKSENWHLVWPQ